MKELMMDPAYEGWAGILTIPDYWDEEEYEEEFSIRKKRKSIRIRNPKRNSGE
jgi:hypothetical protein